VLNNLHSIKLFCIFVKDLQGHPAGAYKGYGRGAEGGGAL